MDSATIGLLLSSPWVMVVLTLVIVVLVGLVAWMVVNAVNLVSSILKNRKIKLGGVDIGKEANCEECKSPKIASWITGINYKTEKEITNLQYDVVDRERGPFLKLFRGVLKNEYVLEIFWRNVKDCLHQTARHNHILNYVRDGYVKPTILKRKMDMIHDRYADDMERFPDLAAWDKVEQKVTEFVIQTLIKFAEVSLTKRKEAEASYGVLADSLQGVPALKKLLEESAKQLYE